MKISRLGNALLALATLTLLGVHALPASAQSLLHTEHPLVGRLWDMSGAKATDEAAVRTRLATAQVVLLGETHDNPEHHRLQARLLEAVVTGGGAPALAMEQLDLDAQEAIDASRNNGADADALARAGRVAKGWDWADYRPLVTLALDRRLPIIATNLPRERLRPVIRGGFAAFDSAELARLQVESSWGPGRDAYLLKVIEASHCGRIDAPLRDGLVRAQRLRDAAMADALLPQLDRGVVAIVGRGHARRDIGVPRYLETRQPGVRILSIGFVEVSPDKTRAEDYESERADGIAPYDVIWFTARAERPDPCASFGKKP